MARDWDPDAIKQALDMDLHMDTDENGNSPSLESMTKDKLRHNAPLAVSVLSHIMLYSDNEPLRARVAQYMIDRVIGKITDTPLVTTGDDDVLKQLVESVVSQGSN